MAPQMNSQIHPVELDIALHTMFTISLAEPSGDLKASPCAVFCKKQQTERQMVFEKDILSSLTKLFHQIFSVPLPPLPSSPLSPALNPLRVKWAYLALSSNFTWFSKFEERQIYPKRAHLLFTSFHLLYTQCVLHNTHLIPIHTFIAYKKSWDPPSPTSEWSPFWIWHPCPSRPTSINAHTLDGCAWRWGKKIALSIQGHFKSWKVLYPSSFPHTLFHPTTRIPNSCTSSWQKTLMAISREPKDPLVSKRPGKKFRRKKYKL